MSDKNTPDCIICKHAILEERSATNSRVIGCDCRECEEDECLFERLGENK